MTDHPRFQVGSRDPEQCYREYHGATMVEWMFRLADWWQRRRSQQAVRLTGSPANCGIQQQLSWSAMMRRKFETSATAPICQTASLLVILSMVLGMLAQAITRGADRARLEPEQARLVAAP